MRLVVNGKPREIDACDEIVITAFLERLEINPRLVAVAVNGDVIRRDLYDDTVIREGDELEVVRMVGGGAR
jgi:sulfur carrier protein